MRVPQNSEVGALTWSKLVMGLQVTGTFPYTLGEGDQKPKFNVPLLLWSIFLQLFSVTGIMVVTSFAFTYTYGAMLGENTIFFSSFAYSFCLALSPSLFMINSKKVLDMIREMGSQEDSKPSPKREWFRNISAFPLVLEYCTVVTISVYYDVQAMGLSLAKGYSVVYLTAVNSVTKIVYYLLLELMEKTYDHLLQRLSQAADDLLQTASSISLVNNTEKASETLISALHGFQLKVRKVSEYLTLI
ncbi:hypothetical protein Pmani_013801 [Petrolisthes manimaculis]|uniref:Uncharacterized protein n=1 Tax=Petrolisthes manimaculis TaxID=1843537 RepID=A0AAE1PXN4_9EUCA|nr:hypothetical protein Pmani_013801 [Petrolisthes manimaculis]